MRCKECNIDLAETYSFCPLCGASAAKEAPKLKDIKIAPYSKSEPIKEADVPKAKKVFSVEKLKALFNF